MASFYMTQNFETKLDNNQPLKLALKVKTRKYLCYTCPIVIWTAHVMQDQTKPAIPD